MTYLGNSINIAAMNRFLTFNLLVHKSEYLLEDREAINKDVERIKIAINHLDSDILLLKQGGNVAGIDLKPLPVAFLDEWKEINLKWISIKKIITDNLIKLNQTSYSEKKIDNLIEIMPEAEILSLIDLSNTLITNLGKYVKTNSENLLFTQRCFIVLDISVILAFMLYLGRKILRPIFALTKATSKVRKLHHNVTAIKTEYHDEDDELSIIT